MMPAGPTCPARSGWGVFTIPAATQKSDSPHRFMPMMRRRTTQVGRTSQVAGWWEPIRSLQVVGSNVFATLHFSHFAKKSMALHPPYGDLRERKYAVVAAASWLSKRLLRSTPLAVVFLCTLSLPDSGWSQSGVTTGPETLPFVEPMDPRPAPSPLERKNLIRRPDNDNRSVAEMLRSSQGGDAILEVVVGRSRLLTLQEPLAMGEGANVPVIATGDPAVLEFDVLPSSQMVRILGRQVGVTDLSVITASGKSFAFEVRVVYDLNYLHAYLQQLYPNVSLQLSQMYEHLVVEGEASSVDQANRVIETVEAWVASVQTSRKIKGKSSDSDAAMLGPATAGPEPAEGDEGQAVEGVPLMALGSEKPDIESTGQQPQIINLIRVPGVQQVMLQVKVAEINRTALRKLGSTWFYRDSRGRTGGFLNSSSNPIQGDTGDLLGLTLGGSATSVAILPNSQLFAALDALRTNQVVNVLAEPNLMAMHGQKASFLAGGEFPVPVPQNIGVGAGMITVQFKEFGVLLDFVPYIMDDGAIRLHVAPEVSTIDDTLGVVSAGISVPGVNTRRANTTVELRQGQTLALAGLIQVELAATTNRIPGLGDLPYLGPLFSNNSHEKTDKELIILVSPYLVGPLEPDEVGSLPGQGMCDPNDCEFYLMNRIEGRRPDIGYRAVDGWDDPWNLRRYKQPANGPLGDSKVHGSYGFSH